MVEDTSCLRAVSSQRFMEAPAVGSLGQGAYKKVGPRLVIDGVGAAHLHPVAPQEGIEQGVGHRVAPSTGAGLLGDEHGTGNGEGGSVEREWIAAPVEATKCSDEGRQAVCSVRLL